MLADVLGSGRASAAELAEIVQVALTPVFFLTAVAALLNVFSTRLGRVADHVDRLSDELLIADERRSALVSIQLTYLRRRSHILDFAVVLATLAGMAICCAAFALFVGALRDKAAAPLLYLLFAAGLLFTIGALGLFLVEMLMASRGLRLEALKNQ
ncbi:MAG: hypothetical protein QOH65_3351 [Methylobacteriaceae bacterium]|jgi:hypothetical protein|nr:hypothetical protein [Methylobacteriaceae bacterium]